MVASSLGMSHQIASITTIATPHYGSVTLNRLLCMPKPLWRIITVNIDKSAVRSGDRKPDSMKLLKELSTTYLKEFNKTNPNVSEVFYQSYSCVLKKPFSSFGMFLAKLVVKLLEGDNDGFVSVKSSKWGEEQYIVYSNTKKGISHQDAVDIKHKAFSNKSGNGVSDICDVYVSICKRLIEKGL